MVNVDIEIGEKIKQLRLDKKLSQQALAEGCGISRSNLNRIENGKGAPSTDTLLKLSEVLGSGLFGTKFAHIHNNEEEVMLSLFKHVLKYHVPEDLDLRTILSENKSFYEDTKGLVIDVIKNRINYHINEKRQPYATRDVSGSKVLYEVGEQPKLTSDDWFK